MPPWLVLLLVLALVIALAYQVATRRYGWRVFLYWAFVFVALAGSEAIAESLGWNFSRYGDLRLAPDLVGGSLAVLALWFLGL